MAFLYARREVQSWLEPLVVSWGDETIAPSPDMGETQFVSFHQWQGTRDLAAFLATPAAIEFQREHLWNEVRERCHALAVETRRRVNRVTGLESISPESDEWFNQLVTIRVPPMDLAQLKTRLYDEFKIEVPVVMWNNQHFIRVSYQGYNTEEDMEKLVVATKKILT